MDSDELQTLMALHFQTNVSFGNETTRKPVGSLLTCQETFLPLTMYKPESPGFIADVSVTTVGAIIDGFLQAQGITDQPTQILCVRLWQAMSMNPNWQDEFNPLNDQSIPAEAVRPEDVLPLLHVCQHVAVTASLVTHIQCLAPGGGNAFKLEFVRFMANVFLKMMICPCRSVSAALLADLENIVTAGSSSDFCCDFFQSRVPVGITYVDMLRVFQDILIHVGIKPEFVLLHWPHMDAFNRDSY